MFGPSRINAFDFSSHNCIASTFSLFNHDRQLSGGWFHVYNYISEEEFNISP